MLRGHPRGLGALFLTEMWERLGFYLIVGILVTYASDAERGGLGLTGKEASAIYGTYLAFVYFTPFFGGIIADRWLGYRRSVLIGGLFFALGFYLLGVRGMTSFYAGLVCLCVGNGFFKPNISAMVGNLYAPGDKMRDAGFNLFYMGINIGSAAANLAAAPIRNEISWAWTFWAAAIGILIGVSVLLANWKLLARAERPASEAPNDFPISTLVLKIVLPAAVAGAVGYGVASWFDFSVLRKVGPSMCGFLLGMVPIFWFFTRLARTEPEAERPGLAALLPIYLAGGTFFMILHMNGSAFTKWAEQKTDREVAVVPPLWKQDALASYYSNAGASVPRPDSRVFAEVDDVAAKLFGTRQFPETALRDLRLPEGVAPVETWSNANGFVPGTDELQRFSAFVFSDDGAHPLRKVAFVREVDGKRIPTVLVTASTKEKVYAGEGASAPKLPPGEFLQVVNQEVYQVWNPLFVVLLTPLFVPFWLWLARRGREVSTARKLLIGMLLTAGAMAVMYVAAIFSGDGSVKVAGAWLVTAYFVLTLGELCLSPMGLSLVTKLSPKRLVGMMMGGWFCATAFGNKLSGFLGEIEQELPPSQFFLILVGAVLLVAGYLRLQLPRLEATLKRYGA